MIYIGFDEGELDEVEKAEKLVADYFRAGSTVIFKDAEINRVSSIGFDSCSCREVNKETGERSAVLLVLIEQESGDTITANVWSSENLVLRFYDDLLVMSVLKK